MALDPILGYGGNRTDLSRSAWRLRPRLAMAIGRHLTHKIVRVPIVEGFLYQSMQEVGPCVGIRRASHGTQTVERKIEPLPGSRPSQGVVLRTRNPRHSLECVEIATSRSGTEWVRSKCSDLFQASDESQQIRLQLREQAGGLLDRLWISSANRFAWNFYSCPSERRLKGRRGLPKCSSEGFAPVTSKGAELGP